MSLSSVLPAIVPSVPRRKPQAIRDNRLRIAPADLASAIALAGPTTSLLTIIWEHALTSMKLAVGGVRHLCCGAAANDAYRRMTTSEFSHINARQAWANWRTIPGNLHGNLPTDRPLLVVDLCCGMGDSTRTLAWWLPAGSQIIGIEVDPRFAAAASASTYRNRAGQVIAVSVRPASVLDGFRDHHGERLADQAVDVVHAIGSIGCHFTPEQTAIIVQECDRVLSADGFALLDTGRAGTSAPELERLAGAHGFMVTGRRRSWWFDRYEQLVLRRAGKACARRVHEVRHLAPRTSHHFFLDEPSCNLPDRRKCRWRLRRDQRQKDKTYVFLGWHSGS